MALAAEDTEVKALWDAYAASRDVSLRERLITHYLPFTRRLAGRLYRVRVWDDVGFDDYQQYARVGLIESVDRFDVARGVSFETFAAHRIRGAILNGLTHETERAAQRQYNARAMTDRQQTIVEGWGHSVPDSSLEELAELVVGLGLGLLLDPAEVPDPSPDANPYQTTELAQLRTAVWALVAQLPERERRVIEGHYAGLIEFKVLAVELGVTNGRVSQLHARAVQRLREGLRLGPGSQSI